MTYGNQPDLFDYMQQHNPNLSRLMHNLPQLTISRTHLKLMKQIVKQLKENKFIVDESGLKNYNRDQPLKIGFNTEKAEYELHVKHTDENTLSKVAIFIKGGEYDSNTPYTPQDTLQKIEEIIKNN